MIDRLMWALKKPRRTVGIYYYLATQLNRKYHSFVGHQMDIVSEDKWDNLILLDGCRYDLFYDECDLEGELEYRVAAGTSSSEFLEKNFVERDRDFHDTVYVTANAYGYQLPDDLFYATISLLGEHWDEEYETVLPETVVDKSLEAFERYPDKKFIIHFMQPHYPFIGDIGDKIEESGLQTLVDGEWTGPPERPIWWQLKYGLVDKELVWDAYRENLELVFPHVEELIKEIPGRTVISSDHGNLVGDKIGPVPTRGFGHPSQLYVEPLMKVPWFIAGGHSRETKSGAPIGIQEHLADGTVEHRLKKLGYI